MIRRLDQNGSLEMTSSYEHCEYIVHYALNTRTNFVIAIVTYDETFNFQVKFARFLFAANLNDVVFCYHSVELGNKNVFSPTVF